MQGSSILYNTHIERQTAPLQDSLFLSNGCCGYYTRKGWYTSFVPVMGNESYRVVGDSI